MNIGALRHRITLQSLVVGSPQKTPAGEDDASWADVATVWASVEPLQGRALELAQQIHSETTGRIRMRYRAGINTAMRVSFGGRVFDIRAVVNTEERNIELVLFTSEGLNDG